MKKIAFILCTGVAVSSAWAEPPALPSEREAGQAIAGHVAELIRQGGMATRIRHIDRIDTGTVSCVPLGRAPDSGVICGTEVRIHGDGVIQRVHYSPVLRHSVDGMWAFDRPATHGGS